MKKIQAVFFDMGGTIDTYHHTCEMRLEQTSGIHQLLLSAGIDLGLSIEKLYEVITSGLERYHTWCVNSLEELPPKVVWGSYILRDFSFDHVALDTVAEDLACFIEMRFYKRELRSEVPPVLEKLHKLGLKIGLISNVNSRGQVPANLSEYQIQHFFNPIVLSSEYGRRKPDPAIFHHAARLSNVPTSSCLYVGDRIARDIVGARKAGFGFAVQIKHHYHHGETDEGAVPDLVIEQMTDLVEFILKVNEDADSSESYSKAGHSQVQALLFDAGDILYYRPERGKFFTEILHSLGIDPEQNHENERYVLRQQAYRGEIEQEEYQKEILGLYGIVQPEQVASGLDAMKKDENNVQFFEGVRETLLELKSKGYLLGIVTDTANPLHAKLAWFEAGGFGHIWDAITSSLDVGVRKPNPKIYQAALGQLGVPAGNAVFLGHKASELAGAKAIGLRTIAFNYDDDAHADFYVEQFADILKVPLLVTEKEAL